MLFSGRAHPELAEQVAKELDVNVTAQNRQGLRQRRDLRAVRRVRPGCDAFVLQSHTAPLNKWLMEQLLAIDALKRGSAKRITAILPFYPYARQGQEAPRPRTDFGSPGRRPAEDRRADRIVSVDLHTDQIQGFFDGPVDHMRAQPLLTGYIKENYQCEDVVVVSPTHRVRVAEKWADALGGTPLAFIHKTRDPKVPNQVKSTASSVTCRVRRAY